MQWQLPGPTVDRAEFIKAMRRVASSVTVVTTDGVAGRHGATVSAFSSVSADPPMVLVCLHHLSRIAGMVVENGVFCVNVLPENSDFVADRFAGLHDRQIADRFAGVRLAEHAQLPEIDGATVFSCRVDQRVSAGSHVAVFGLVTGVQGGDAEPLAYLDGAYHRVLPKAGQALEGIG